YTFSKVLGIRDGVSQNGAQSGPMVNPLNVRSNYGVLGYDHTHIFNAAYVLSLPSPIHGNAFLKGAVNGWQLSGVTQWQSGSPLQPQGNPVNGTWAPHSVTSISTAIWLASVPRIGWVRTRRVSRWSRF